MNYYRLIEHLMAAAYGASIMWIGPDMPALAGALTAVGLVSFILVAAINK